MQCDLLSGRRGTFGNLTQLGGTGTPGIAVISEDGGRDTMGDVGGLQLCTLLSESVGGIRVAMTLKGGGVRGEEIISGRGASGPKIEVASSGRSGKAWGFEVHTGEFRFHLTLHGAYSGSGQGAGAGHELRLTTHSRTEKSRHGIRPSHLL